MSRPPGWRELRFHEILCVRNDLLDLLFFHHSHLPSISYCRNDTLFGPIEQVGKWLTDDYFFFLFPLTTSDLLPHLFITFSLSVMTPPCFSLFSSDRKGLRTGLSNTI